MILKIFSNLNNSVILVLSFLAKAFSKAALSQDLFASEILVRIYPRGVFIVSPPMPVDIIVQKPLLFVISLHAPN